MTIWLCPRNRRQSQCHLLSVARTRREFGRKLGKNLAREQTDAMYQDGVLTLDTDVVVVKETRIPIRSSGFERAGHTPSMSPCSQVV